MPEKEKQRFRLTKRSIAPGETHDDVRLVQQYLRRFGYLRVAATARQLDAATQEALKLFQARAQLPQTGAIDEATAAALERRRCGVPDIEPAQQGPVGAFVLRGCSYEAQFRTLTYAFEVGTPDVFGSDEKQAVRNAFSTWQQQIAIDFAEVGVVNAPNFKLGWFSGDHGDGYPFDGVGNTLAHAFYPPTCGGVHAGKLHCDEAEAWALAGGAGVFDTETIALHEIGHLLGLAHSAVPSAVMYPFYNGQLRALTQDDINGIRAIYGRRGPTLDVLVHLQDIGDRGFRENEFAGTRGQARRLEGFQLQINPAVPNLSMRYMAHLQNIGDVPYVNEGMFVGTRGQARRLEGFAIELTGAAAPNFAVVYMAHLQNTADTGWFQNGQFCGTRGEARRVEGILVRVEPRP